VRAFGTGSPEPRDWGETQACTYAAQASSSTATAFTASYDFGFLRILIVAATTRGLWWSPHATF
jgi:hypothetical protein